MRNIWNFLSLLSLLVGGSVCADEAHVVDGRVVHLTKESPVFKTPSPKSKVVADVEKGTTVIVRKLSPKKSWILVEDEDKNQGWIPRNRTDFADLSSFETPKKVKNDSLEPMVIEDKNKADENAEAPSSLFSHYFSLIGRRSFSDPNGNQAWGPSYALFFPRAWDATREHRLAFQSAFLFVKKNKEKNNFTIPLRFRMLSREKDSRWGTGTDLTLYFMRQPSSSDKNMWSLGLGYSVAYLPQQSGFFPALRAGLEVFHKTRFSLEASLGYLL